MLLISEFLTALVIVIHLYIVWLEMFAWTSRGPKVFRGFPKELFEPTKAMAANQGLYNGFLAAGLIWSFWINDLFWAEHVTTFFLSCVVIAGLYGAWSVQKTIFFIQALPAILALIFLHFA
ncbi:MAG: DUF1304 domain-containing protein [Bacteroidota bacterium]